MLAQSSGGAPRLDTEPPGNEKPARAAGGVADHVRRGRRHHLHHQADDVPRRPELAVLPGRRNLAEHVLLDVALGVSVLHRDAVRHAWRVFGSTTVVVGMRRLEPKWEGSPSKQDSRRSYSVSL